MSNIHAAIGDSVKLHAGDRVLIPSGFKVEYGDERNPYTESRRDQVDPKSKKQKKEFKK